MANIHSQHVAEVSEDVGGELAICDEVACPLKGADTGKHARWSHCPRGPRDADEGVDPIVHRALP